MTAPAPRDFPDRVLRDALVRPYNLCALLRRTHPQLADRPEAAGAGCNGLMAPRPRAGREVLVGYATGSRRLGPGTRFRE